jgi:serine phosphatase RsbU (regulator of sigma subunit)
MAMLSTRTPRPTVLPSLPALDLQTRYYSARTGGDFFDVIAINSYVVFLLTDIAGIRDRAHTIATEVQDTLHRRGAALFGAANINMTDAVATLAHDINQTILTSAGGVCFSPTFLACFDTSVGILAYVNAGGAPAVFRDRDGTRILGSVTMPLGLFTHLTYEPAVQAFEPGARLLLVTKGIVDAQRGRNHFGLERLGRILDGFGESSACDLAETVVQQVHQFRELPWYSLRNLPFIKPERVEDLTATVLQRAHLRSDGSTADLHG